VKCAHLVYVCFLLFMLTGVLASQGVPPTPLAQTSTPAAPEPVERQIRKAVAFITEVCLNGNAPIQVQGTGFWVAYPDSRLSGNRTFNYLVTNRHVAECWDNNRTPMRVLSVSVRLNLTDGTSKDIPCGTPEWIFPPDGSVDLAVTNANPDPKVYDIRTIPFSGFATEDVIKKESISEGLKILFSGFFYQVPGLTQIEPIVREGVIAMMPDENLITTTGKTGKIYLGEVHAFHGNSGSPVFVDVGGLRGVALRGFDYRLLGVVSGGYSEGDQNNLIIENPLKDRPGNSGIAIIVPASELRVLLEDPRLVATRDAAVSKETQQASKK
jgi:hypothetical protein